MAVDSPCRSPLACVRPPRRPHAALVVAFAVLALAVLGACNDSQDANAVPQPPPQPPLDARSVTGTYHMEGAWVDSCHPDLVNPADGVRGVTVVTPDSIVFNQLIWLGDLTCSGMVSFSVLFDNGVPSVAGDQPGMTWSGAVPPGLPATLTGTRVFYDFPLAGMQIRDVVFVDDTAVPPRVYSGLQTGPFDADGYPTQFDSGLESVFAPVAPAPQIYATSLNGTVPLLGPTWYGTCVPDAFGNGTAETLTLQPTVSRLENLFFAGDPACAGPPTGRVVHFLLASYAGERPGTGWDDGVGGTAPPPGLPDPVQATGVNVAIMAEAEAEQLVFFADDQSVPTRLYRGMQSEGGALSSSLYLVRP